MGKSLIRYNGRLYCICDSKVDSAKKKLESKLKYLTDLHLVEQQMAGQIEELKDAMNEGSACYGELSLVENAFKSLRKHVEDVNRAAIMLEKEIRKVK